MEELKFVIWCLMAVVLGTLGYCAETDVQALFSLGGLLVLAAFAYRKFNNKL